MFDAFVPFSLAAFPAAFFIAYGRPNQEQSSLLQLTVLLLLRGERQMALSTTESATRKASAMWSGECRKFCDFLRRHLG